MPYADKEKERQYQKEKMRRYRQNPEYKAKKVAYDRARYQGKKSKGTRNVPRIKELDKDIVKDFLKLKLV